MSASERLKALDLGPGFIDDAELSVMGYDGLLALRDALPEIIALVEAAENPSLFDYDNVGEQAQEQFAAALAALDEALTTKGER